MIIKNLLSLFISVLLISPTFAQPVMYATDPQNPGTSITLDAGSSIVLEDTDGDSTATIDMTTTDDVLTIGGTGAFSKMVVLDELEAASWTTTRTNTPQSSTWQEGLDEGNDGITIGVAAAGCADLDITATDTKISVVNNDAATIIELDGTTSGGGSAIQLDDNDGDDTLVIDCGVNYPDTATSSTAGVFSGVETFCFVPNNIMAGGLLVGEPTWADFGGGVKLLTVEPAAYCNNREGSVAGILSGYLDNPEYTITGGAIISGLDLWAGLTGSNGSGSYCGAKCRSVVKNSAGMSEFVSFGSYPSASAGSGTVTAVKHFEIDDISSNMTCTTQYGLYISDTLNQASTNWAIYSNGTTPAYFGGALTVVGALSQWDYIVTNDTDGKTVAASESATINTNAGASGGGIWNLPEASTCIGSSFIFSVSAAQNMDINPDDADQILVLTNAAGDAIRSATPGHTVTLCAIDSTNWVVLGEKGTWTDVD